MADTGIIGAGSWGTALAVMLCNNGHKAALWSHKKEQAEKLDKERENKEKLPGVAFPEKLMITADIKEAVRGKDLVVMAVPSVAVRSVSALIKDYAAAGQIITDVSKGIEEKTLMTMTQVIEEEIPQARVTILSGPTHAEEAGRGLPTTVVAGSHDLSTAKYVQNIFMSPVFRVYTSLDMLGMEIGGALKNVIALAAGMADGLGYGDNTKAALITRGLAEITRLGVAMGAKESTFAGLSGIGDLVVTCASMHSRNRRAGILIGKGATMKEAMEEVRMVVEGVHSAKSALALSRKYNVEMPIVEAVNEVLFKDKAASDVVGELMGRVKKQEYQFTL